MDTADKTNAEAMLETDTQDLNATQDRLLAAERYHENMANTTVREPGHDPREANEGTGGRDRFVG